MFKQWLKDENGQALAEYGLLIALIAVIAVGVITTFGKEIKCKFHDLTKGITGTNTACPQ